MSLKDLHQRYLYIAKNSLSFLKDKGFKKKGTKYIKQKGELILEVLSFVPRPLYNTEESYKFLIGFEVSTINPAYIEVYRLLEDVKNIKKAALISNSLFVDQTLRVILTPTDPPGRDEELARGFQEKIARDIVPWFETVSSLADMTKLAEEEYLLERGKRRFFKVFNIDRSLLLLYAAQGMKEKALAMCDQYVEGVPQTSRYLAEKNKAKILKYLEEREKSP